MFSNNAVNPSVMISSGVAVPYASIVCSQVWSVIIILTYACGLSSDPLARVSSSTNRQTGLLVGYTLSFEAKAYPHAAPGVFNSIDSGVDLAHA